MNRADRSRQQQTFTIQQALDLGMQHHTARDLSTAEGIYQQILKADPNQPDALHLLGVIAHQVGKHEVAEEHITKALSIKPDWAEALANLGNALMAQGKLEEAAASHRKALEIKPDFAEVHNNLGNALKELGRLEEAVASYRQAIAIKPGHVETHSNLGTALRDLGKLNEAEASHRKSLELHSSFAAGHYNLHPFVLDPGDMEASIQCMQKAVELDPESTNYRFYLGMLLDYSGKSGNAKTHFDLVESGETSGRAKLDAWQYIKSANDKIPPMVGSSFEGFKIGIDAAANDGLVLEFGVRFGTTIRQIAALVNQEVHGFDSFEGLPDAWHNEPKGSYSTKGVIPSVQENVTLHNGWFEDTLPGFIKKHQAPVRFMNIDCDIYSSTKTVLDLLAKQIVAGTVISFDEYIGNETWRDDEFKAFQEAALKYGWNYEYLCFSFVAKQVVVQIH